MGYSMTDAAPTDPVITIRRQFVRVGDRNVHYRVAGAGPVVVLIHPSPYNGAYWTDAMRRWGRKFTCIALDSPGFGLSDPLPRDDMTVDGMTFATAEAIHALGIRSCAVVGSHTGAAIALELGVAEPSLVTGMVLEAVPAFSEEEKAEWFTHSYFSPLKVSEYGEHLTWAWTRARDADRWFPWIQRKPEKMYNPVPSSATKIHGDVADYFLCADHYIPAYRSAVFYDKAATSLAALAVPVLVTANSGDVMVAHLDRLGTLKRGQRIQRLDADPAIYFAAIEEFLGALRHQASAPIAEPTLTGGPGIGKLMVDLPHGQVMVRYAGGDQDPVLVLHDAPGSGLALEPALRAAEKTRRIVAIDLPGCGESVALSADVPPIEAYADCIVGVCDALGLSTVTLHGIGVGASVALATKMRHPTRVGRVTLQNMLPTDPVVRARGRSRIAPKIELRADGAHWYATWLMLRDSLSTSPWLEGSEAVRQVPRKCHAQSLHEWTHEVMKQWQHYHHIVFAAADSDDRAILATADCSVVLSSEVADGCRIPDC